MAHKKDALKLLKAARRAPRARRYPLPEERPPTPGDILLHEFLRPLEQTQTWLSEQTGIPRSALSLIITGKRGVTADTALKFARVFGNTPQFWMGLQAAVDLWDAVQREKGAA